MSDRTWNQIDARLYEEDWSQGAIITASCLIARCPNQYGVFDTPLGFLKLFFRGLYTPSEIDGFMIEWEGSGFVKFYRDRKLVWIKNKWRRMEKYANWKHIKGLKAFIEAYPEVKKDFVSYYDIESLPNHCSIPEQPLERPKQRYTDSESESDTETKETNMPSKTDGDKKPAVVSSHNKKHKPIEEREAHTDNQKAAKFWHVKYLEVHGVKYSGDIKKIGGQISRIVKRHGLGDVVIAMDYLLDQEHGQYIKHTFDHLVKNISQLIIEAKEKGYEFDG